MRTTIYGLMGLILCATAYSADRENIVEQRPGAPLPFSDGVRVGDTLYVAETHQGRLYQWALAGPGQIAGYMGPQHRGTVLADPEGNELVIIIDT